MNWSSFGDTTSLMIYDTVYQLCKATGLPLFHVTMLTPPQQKTIRINKNDRYRYGRLNTPLVKIMERCLLMIDLKLIEETTSTKKNRSTRRIAIKQIEEKLRKEYNEWKYNSRHSMPRNSDYLAKPYRPTGLISENRKIQENLIVDVANYFNRNGIDVKMVFKESYRGRNTVPIGKIEYFNDVNRKLYFEKIASKLSRKKIDRIVLIEPDIGIQALNTTSVKNPSKEFIYADEVLKILNSVSRNSIVAIRHSYRVHKDIIGNLGEEFFERINNRISFFDKYNDTSLLLFFNSEEKYKEIVHFEKNIFRNDSLI